MELVYLWVEDYKNIHKQGFNFSPRFECEFKDKYEKDENSKKILKDNCELIIEKKEYKSIFPDNVNVTAIVGENGSSKSSILEVIEKIILNGTPSEQDNFKYIIVYRTEELFYISNIEIKASIEKETIFNDICTLSYKYHISHEEMHDARSYSSANFHYINIKKEGVVSILSAKKEYIESFQISSFMYTPTKVEISLKPYQQLIKEHIEYINFHNRDKLIEISKSITDLYHQYLSICYIKQEDSNTNLNVLKDKDLLTRTVKNRLEETEFHSFFSVVNKQEYVISEMSKEKYKIYFSKDYWHFFEFDFIDEKDRKYNHLSHGEKVIYAQLLNIYFYIHANDKLLFLFDEPEIALHPNWQRLYLSEVINLLKNKNKNYHFVVTSHSPFILSDIPKENVIFLEKGKQVDVDIETFGANIHTLLSHGFFMKDGLMGEFAKEKINETIKFLNKEQSEIKNEKEAKNIIDTLGEPFLKEKLTELYDTNYPPSKEEQIKRLQEQIKELENADT